MHTLWSITTAWMNCDKVPPGWVSLDVLSAQAPGASLPQWLTAVPSSPGQGAGVERAPAMEQGPESQGCSSLQPPLMERHVPPS